MIRNVIKGLHILGRENGNLKLNSNRQYHWHIPKRLRQDQVQQGDIVLVFTSRGKRPVLVMDVYREEIREKKKKYKQIVKVMERAPK